ncbi:hypothetical protein BDV25DRAFT_136407 [Aspergillus avenaceus]|uniref:Uncharacterized protein n=1 Tax=Aspergillus avenaceus TaxID=36643 RepID=A0A5N6U6I2_ASPAV|nr:hypothetical protein BDV25DRAFT_136407 [Aspergillus avenaceus]
MKIRKHTVNDNFHASNVARSRLTLKPHTHRGIFNRGKTSPPVKMRQDLCFSEMEFLSNKPPTIQEPVNTGYQLRGDGGLNSPQMNNNPLALPATVVMKDQQQACHASPNQDQDRPPVHTNKSAQYKNQGDGSSDRTAILYSWSETVRLSLPPQDPFEAYTERLLNANLDTYDTNDKDMISNQPKKYWNLEELAYLLEQRTALWDSNTDVPTGSTNQNTNNTNIKSLKRKRASLIEQEVPVQTTSAARINGNCYYYYSNNNIEQHISSETPNNQVSEVEAAAPSKGGINIKNRSTQALLEDNTMERTQTQEQDDIMDVLMEDFTLYSGESSFNPFSLPSEDMGRIPYFGQSDEPSMSKRLEASMWPYRQNQNRDMTDAAEPLLSDRTLIKQALSAAYDVIMNPEKDPLYNGHTYDEKMDSAMKSGPTSVCSDEDAYQVSETFQDPSTGGHFGKPLLGQALPSYPYRATGEKQLLDPMDWNYTAFRSPPVEHFPETICSASEMQGLKIEAESRPCFKTKLEFQASLHSELGKFWRPQKLY